MTTGDTECVMLHSQTKCDANFLSLRDSLHKSSSKCDSTITPETVPGQGCIDYLYIEPGPWHHICNTTTCIRVWCKRGAETPCNGHKVSDFSHKTLYHLRMDVNSYQHGQICGHHLVVSKSVWIRCSFVRVKRLTDTKFPTSLTKRYIISEWTLIVASTVKIRGHHLILSKCLWIRF